MIKKINAYVVICITTLICFSGCQLTDEENNAPDIRIHINDNYEEESRVACINEEYYYIKDLFNNILFTDIFHFIKKIWGIGIKVGYKDGILSWAR